MELCLVLKGTVVQTHLGAIAKNGELAKRTFTWIIF